MQANGLTLLLLITLGVCSATGWASAQDERRYFRLGLPPELQFSCVGALDEREVELGKMLDGRDPGARIVAARELWEGHSRQHARAVLRLVAGDPLRADGFAALKRDVEASLTPDAVRRELHHGDYKWGAWLAGLRPHGDHVPVLLAALTTRPGDRPETVLALGYSRDLRALDPLLGLLAGTDYRAAGDAAQALGLLGFPEVEPRLIDALGRAGWVQVQASRALGRVGTRQALPALEKLATTRGYTGALDVRGAAMRAVAAIERRGRPPEPERRPAAVLRGHTGAVGAVAFAPVGTTLASASEDQTVRVWDTQTGRQTARFTGHARLMRHVAFGPGGQTLFTAGWGNDGSVKVLDARTGVARLAIPATRGAVSSMVVSPDGLLVAAVGPDEGDYPVRVWDAKTGEVVAPLTGMSVAVAFSSDGRLLAATAGAEDDSDLRLWDVATKRVTATLRGHVEGATTGAFSPDGRVFVSGGDWTARLWDARTGKAGWVVRGDSRVEAVAFSPDGRSVAVGEEDRVRVVDVASGRVAAVLPGRGPVAFRADGKQLATGAEDRTVILLWDATDLNPAQ